MEDQSHKSGEMCQKYYEVMLYLKEICGEDGVNELVKPFPLFVVSTMIHTFAHRYASIRMAALTVIGVLMDARYQLMDRQAVTFIMDIDGQDPPPTKNPLVR